MRRNARCPRNPRNSRYPRYARPEVPAPQRGNSIVLVMGILVLLVIIATAFITRTHAQRVTSSVAVRTTLRDDNARAMAEMLAYEIGAALFPFPIDPLLLGFDVPVNSNTPRLSQRPLDLDGDGIFEYIPLRYATDPTDPYNFASYHVVPFTNWPDTTPGSSPDPFWPHGPGNDGGGTGSPNLSAEGNPVGNPGFSDARWLADIEPLRWDTNLDGIPDAFSHWRHMTNIARPNNGWRIVGDISNVGNSMITDLSIPMEQWLVVQPVADMTDGSALFNTFNGDTVYNPDHFNRRWEEWFLNYGAVYYQPMEIPPNFYNLSNLNANIFPLEPGERPQDEFIGPSSAWPIGTPRWNVNRILVDTDGDGYTDSFWFLAPTMTERGIRQILAVRIVDNGAMLNANVATRFLRNDLDFGATYKTRGWTPAELALVGELNSQSVATNTWNVGFYDNADHWFVGPGYETRYRLPIPNENSDTDFPWMRHVMELGLVDNLGDPILRLNQVGRLSYWQEAGLRPFEPSIGSNLTPFGLTEELELRMFHGQNYPWIFSRYEFATQSVAALNIEQFLRASLGREESSEYLDQLSNFELFGDHRSKLTMYNGARNDEMPPWLWWRWELPDDVVDQAAMNPADIDGNGVADVIDRFLAQARRKLDLREEAIPPLFDGERNLAYRLPRTLMLALTDGDQANGNSYYGAYNNGPLITALTYARRLAAGLAANILEIRDADSDYGLVQTASVPLPQVGSDGQSLTQRFLGMEKQPFLVEALIGHVYKSDFTVPLPPDAYTNSGNNMIYQDSPHSTIVIVQIANPFDEVLILNDFRLHVFPDAGNPHEVNFSTLPNPNIDPGEARTFYAIENELDGAAFRDPWVDVLQLDSTFSQSVNVTDPASGISNERSVYDIGNEERAIELVRIMGSNANGNVGNIQVLIDRIDISAPTEEDDFEFGETVEQLANTEPAPFPNPFPPPFQDTEFPGLDIGDDTYWIQWVHVSREWDVNEVIQADERNPRYVFAARDVDLGVDSFEVATSDDGDVVFTEFSDGDNFHFHQSFKEATTGFPLNFSMQMLQKDADFEQVGELLNVWMFGHLLEFEPGLPGQIDTAYIKTVQTFSEFMINDKVAGQGVRANRLTIVPDVVGLGEGLVGQVVGVPDSDDPNYLLNPLHAVPAVPAGVRVLDAFVCESLGVNVGGSRLGNANGFTGKITPGLININTAPPEVMRSAPHMTRLVHEIESPGINPFVRVPEAIVQYRERFGDPTVPSTDFTPDYGDRGNDTFIDDLRGERGIASIGEIGLLTRLADGFPPLEPDSDLYKKSFTADFAGRDPFTTGESTRISTDVNDLPGNNPDIVAKDAEELNLLFSGMSNMLTTRSDVFTVYFRVRSFIQNPTTGIWDATNPEFIVDDSRYVMLVDRSEMNQPNDKPKILYLEKLPK